jgi:hypothetical protein
MLSFDEPLTEREQVEQDMELEGRWIKGLRTIPTGGNMGKQGEAAGTIECEDGAVPSKDGIDEEVLGGYDYDGVCEMSTVAKQSKVHDMKEKAKALDESNPIVKTRVRPEAVRLATTVWTSGVLKPMSVVMTTMASCTLEIWTG